MSTPRLSSLLVLCCLGLVACADTKITDHALLPTQTPLAAEQLGKTLLVVETALPADQDDREAKAAEAKKLVTTALSFATEQTATAESEEQLLRLARKKGLDSVLIVRVDEYARHGNLQIGISVPPVVWDTNTTISLRLRVLNAKTGAVVADLRRDRVRGGTYVIRDDKDLAEEMKEALRSFVL